MPSRGNRKPNCDEPQERIPLERISANQELHPESEGEGRNDSNNSRADSCLGYREESSDQPLHIQLPNLRSERRVTLNSRPSSKCSTALLLSDQERLSFQAGVTAGRQAASFPGYHALAARTKEALLRRLDCYAQAPSAWNSNVGHGTTAVYWILRRLILEGF